MFPYSTRSNKRLVPEYSTLAQYSAILHIPCSRSFQYACSLLQNIPQCVFPAKGYCKVRVSCLRIFQSACILLQNIPQCVYPAPEYSTMHKVFRKFGKQVSPGRTFMSPLNVFPQTSNNLTKNYFFPVCF